MLSRMVAKLTCAIEVAKIPQAIKVARLGLTSNGMVREWYVLKRVEVAHSQSRANGQRSSRAD